MYCPGTVVGIKGGTVRSKSGSGVVRSGRERNPIGGDSLRQQLIGLRRPRVRIGATTTLAALGSGASRTASRAWVWALNQAGAAQPSRRGSAGTRGLAQTFDQRDASSAPCYAKPNGNKARAALHDRTNGNRDQSPDSCTDLLDWHAQCHAPAVLVHQNGEQEEVSKG